MSNTRRILIVHDNPQVATRVAALLASAGHASTLASSFDAGKSLMATVAPAIVITGVRLGAFHGLHLIIRGRIDDPLLTAILVSDAPDPLLAAEAARHGAHFLVHPDESERLIEIVTAALADDQV